MLVPDPGCAFRGRPGLKVPPKRVLTLRIGCLGTVGTMKISRPVLFIAGEKDTVIRGASADQLTALMKNALTDLRGVKVFPGAGHWIQQERPEETNAAMLDFLKGLNRP